MRTWLLGLSVFLLVGTASVSCTDDRDACREFCRKAAECLQCGATADVDACRQTCYDLSIDEKKALGNCATDCENVMACPAFTTHPELNPCR